MTTANVNTAHAKTPLPEPARFRLPDIPQREPDEVTSYDHLHRFGMAHSLAVHLGNPDTTLVEADRWITAAPGAYRELACYPDLLVAFDADAALYKASNGYIISEQGKPPDFVLEVSSESTGSLDVNEKREDYARLGIPEYWRFDETGQYHGTRLAGDRLVDGRYEAIDIEELAEDVLQGYSAALNLHLHWEGGELVLHDPATGRRITTLEDERVARMQAEARVRELEAQLQQLHGN